MIIALLIYFAFICGNDEDHRYPNVIDNSNNAFVTGTIGSTDYDTTNNAYQMTYKRSSVILVTKLNSTWSLLVYSTFVGGSDENVDPFIAMDGRGNAYVAEAQAILFSHK